MKTVIVGPARLTGICLLAMVSMPTTAQHVHERHPTPIPGVPKSQV